MSIKEVTKSMFLDRIEWLKRVHVVDSDNMWRIHSQPQSFETKAWLLDHKILSMMFWTIAKYFKV